MGIPLNYNGKQFGDVKYSELDNFTRSQVDDCQFRVSIIKGGDVTKVVDKLININDGEPWGSHERRDVLWTSVSFDIKNILLKTLFRSYRMDSLGFGFYMKKNRR